MGRKTKTSVLYGDLQELYYPELVKAEHKLLPVYAKSFRAAHALILLEGDEVKPKNKCKTCLSRGYRMIAPPKMGKHNPEDFNKVACHCIIDQTPEPDMVKMQKKALEYEKAKQDLANSRGVAQDSPQSGKPEKGTGRPKTKRTKTVVIDTVPDGRGDENQTTPEAVQKPRKKRVAAKGTPTEAKD